MDIPDYSEYGFEDFLMDADFRTWVTQPTPDTDAFWRRFVATHPELRKTISEAIWAVEHLTIQPYRLSAGSQERIWQRLDATYDRVIAERSALVDDESDSVVRPMPMLGRTWFRVAASLTGALLMAGAVWYTTRPPVQHTIQTALTEMKRVTLPDGSVVTLNRNSSLTYTDNWNEDRPREVWVDGEAFFAVQRHAATNATQPTRPSDAFIVHTNMMNVEVLGTKFDVNTRRGKARVVLNEGKVKLTRQREGVEESMMMRPGDLVDVIPAKEGFVKRRVKADNYDAWKSGQLQFDQTTIAEIIDVLEDTYGWQVTLNAPKLGKQTFSATVPASQPDLLLALLTESFGVKIRRHGNTVTID
ncbi:FecR family protein [Fibrella forsythiae]|uniref:FecR domain-containing protein n=1 Tax=Fibrella forsythiae TaxID=2817061 RepID=A0ABS3JPV2_9BACT|nr:FecR domain-containing protein [Fibrella forsythiae]MBO0951436.1 FecR domain-containing protein [Fibrella forsythiae]